MDQSALLIIAMGVVLTLCLAGVGFALFAPSLEGKGTRTNKRLKTIRSHEAVARPSKSGPQDKVKDRRRHVEETLARIEEQQQQKKKKVSLPTKIERAGLAISTSTFYIASAICGVVCALGVWLLMPNLIVVGAVAFSATIGVPNWALGFLGKRRQSAFLKEFANSIDVIVRGVEAGLPLNDCLQIIANEASAPVGPEFQQVVEAGRIGVPVGDALDDMFDRIPVPELNFFAIVLSLQSKTGGNLSEALRNLSTVLRNRKMMKAKIEALSGEAKASAMILGALPPGVMVMIYMTTPDYIMDLFYKPTGNLLLIGGGLWMLMGILVMRKMINFKF